MPTNPFVFQRLLLPFHVLLCLFLCSPLLAYEMPYANYSPDGKYAFGYLNGSQGIMAQGDLNTCLLSIPAPNVHTLQSFWSADSRSVLVVTGYFNLSVYDVISMFWLDNNKNWKCATALENDIVQRHAPGALVEQFLTAQLTGNGFYIHAQVWNNQKHTFSFSAAMTPDGPQLKEWVGPPPPAINPPSVSMVDPAQSDHTFGPTSDLLGLRLGMSEDDTIQSIGNRYPDSSYEKILLNNYYSKLTIDGAFGVSFSFADGNHFLAIEHMPQQSAVNSFTEFTQNAKRCSSFTVLEPILKKYGKPDVTINNINLSNSNRSVYLWFYDKSAIHKLAGNSQNDAINNYTKFLKSISLISMHHNDWHQYTDSWLFQIPTPDTLFENQEEASATQRYAKSFGIILQLVIDLDTGNGVNRTSLSLIDCTKAEQDREDCSKYICSEVNASGVSKVSTSGLIPNNKPFDHAALSVADVKLGMTPDQAISALKWFNWNYTVEKRYAKNGDWAEGSTMEDWEKSGTPSDLYLTKITALSGDPSDSKSNVDSVDVILSPVPGHEKVIGIVRTAGFADGSEPLLEGVKKDLMSKYAALGDPIDGGSSLTWVFSPSGIMPQNLVTYRGKSGSGFDRFGPAVTLSATITPGSGDKQDVAKHLTIELDDELGLFLAPEQAKQDAAQAVELARENEKEKASSNSSWLHY